MDKLLQILSPKNLLEALPDAIILSDKEGIIKSCNSKVTKIFGYEAEELIGLDIEVLMPTRFKHTHKRNVQGYYSSPEERKMASYRKVMGQKKDGSEFEVDITLSTIQLDSQLFAIAACRDITDKKENERKLEKQNLKLEAENKSLEKFNYTVSHDLKAPLAKIQGLLGLLTQEIEMGMPLSEINTISGYIKKVTESMSSMITDILDEVQKTKQNTDEEVIMAELWEEIKEMVFIPTLFKIHIKCDFLSVKGKRSQLLQIFLNLFSNAIKYNDKEKGLLSVLGREEEELYVFVVSDNGKGISTDKLGKIFDLFEKDTKESYQHSHGIGLFTVKSIIKARGGNISVYSKEGKGTVFQFSWPKKPIIG